MASFRILVADDHELMRKAVRALLEGDPGQQVIGEAATGLETITQVGFLNPDLLILDLVMPELDGLEVAARLRRTHPQTQIILLTATATPAVESEAMAVGIYRCVSKSNAPKVLMAAVDELRNRRPVSPLLLPARVASEDPRFGITQFRATAPSDELGSKAAVSVAGMSAGASPEKPPRQTN